MKNQKSIYANLFAVSATFLVLTLLALVAVMQIIPYFAPLVASPLFIILHESHDLLAVMVALYIAHKFSLTAGWWAVAWILIIHIPLAYVTFPNQMPELIRLLMLTISAIVGVRIITIRSRLEMQLNELATNMEVQRIAAFQRAEELTILNRIATLGVEATSVEMLIENAIQIIDRVLHPDYFGIGLVDNTAGVLRINRSTRTMKSDFLALPLGKCVAGQVLATGKPLRISDVSREPLFNPVNPDVRSELCVPLKAGELVIGLINIESKRLDAFSMTDERLMTTFAGQLVAAIERVRLFQLAQRHEQEAETLRQAGTIVASTLNQDEAIERILVQLERVVPYDTASVQLLHEGYLEIVGGRGWENPAAVVGMRFPIPGDNPNTIIIQSRKPYILGDARLTYSAFREKPHSHICSFLGVPLIVGDQVIGMLAVDNSQPNYFTSDHARLFAAFADQVALAIQNARLYAQVERRADQLRALREVDHVLSSELDLQIVLQTLVESARRLADARYAALGVVDEKGKLVSFYNTGMTEAERQLIGSLPHGLGLLGTLLQEMTPIRLPEIGKDSRSVGFPPNHPPMKSFLGVPIMAHGVLVGSLYLTEKIEEPVFTQEDEELIVGLAADAAIAIQNAKLFGEVQHLASTDSLTGLSNRRYLIELGEREFGRARRYQHPLTAIILDIDHFKKVNDTYGHAVGDQVLQDLAARCRRIVREIDIVGRYGGEEFVVLLLETDLKGACVLAERLRRHISESPIDTDGGAVTITVSLGVTVLDDQCADLDHLLQRADQALYVSKREGRNRVSMWQA